MAKAAARKATGPVVRKVRLIASDSKRPEVALKPGVRLDVVSVALIDPQFKPVRPGAARLCGGTSTCLALVDLDPLFDPARAKK